MVRQALAHLADMNPEQEIIRVDRSHIPDRLLDHDTAHDIGKVGDLVPHRKLLPIRSQDGKQCHGVTDRLILNPAEIREDRQGRRQPPAIVGRIEACLRRAGDRRADNLRQLAEIRWHGARTADSLLRQSLLYTPRDHAWSQ